MERELPVITIEETDFMVDVHNITLKEQGNEDNTISIFHMRELKRGYEFIYDKLTKSMSLWTAVDENRVVVAIPEMVDLDPIGMSLKYGVPVEELQTKNDFELMVDQEALRRRLDGELPIIEIEGHSFIVDLANNRLAPSRDTGAPGISFAAIEACYDDEKEAYIITFNTKEGAYQPVDFEKINVLPEDIVAVSIPFELQLDPIGFNQKYGSEEFQFLKEYNVALQIKAQEVSWQKFGLPNHVMQPQKKGVKQVGKNESVQRKRGRRL
ncbi:hypothetical protein [Sphingobacterium siyangense]|uniref:hypothetical protein n=1 Tax=Sphingobacterium siyangense TaxID=459529 RepID=UPI001964E260|nr:hypothetical protein [Sphingobacterium siyangense]QRY55576.1 hypothetical protein JVX97_16175 [Sphingobacterium siyangense]